MLVASLNYDPHRSRIVIGKIQRARTASGDPVVHLGPDGDQTQHRVTHLAKFEGVGQRTVEQAEAGDNVALAGIDHPRIGVTPMDPVAPEALPTMRIEEPTLKLTFDVNTSLLAGREGRHSTSRQLHGRLFRELETNLSHRVATTD